MSEQTTTPEATTEAEAPVATAIEQALVAGRKPKNKLGNCECAGWEIGFTVDKGDDEPEVTIETTGCDKVTKRMFAQGHDAKLKSLFIRAGVAGMEVRYGRHAGVLVSTDAETAAARFGFEAQVKAGILNRLDKLAKARKPIPAAPRDVPAEVVEGSQEGDEPIDAPAIPEAPADQDAWTEEAEPGDEVIESGVQTVQGKVGRWTYEGTVAADGSFHYRAGNDPEGEPRVAEQGKWSPVA